ncbi:uncharacterized protein RHO25_000217 [Cercospora beticola]|uniref:Secreted protein n=1 Tax=Cercospora beticola TaxID=122368 RepID=A0ABZ0N7W4_CERBT|nr:hypothetical protein RHO25_000217 [Cercospora beticola]CAK1356151.1 unnamed protein product [Cercospora beticola]
MNMTPKAIATLRSPSLMWFFLWTSVGVGVDVEEVTEVDDSVVDTDVLDAMLDESVLVVDSEVIDVDAWVTVGIAVYVVPPI